jgi:transcriptional regulator with XRE-family HTH domain
MRDAVIGRLFRMTRFRRGWTQAELAMKAGLSPTVISRIEAGQASRYRLAVLQRHGDALGLRAEIGVMGRGGEAVRLLDEEHAAIVEYVATLLRHADWSVDAEASFNHFGDRGRIDLLAFHPGSGMLLIVEAKTEVTDLQDLFGSLDVRERHAPRLAVSRGWTVRRVATLLAVADVERNRRTIRAHRTLFERFERHGMRVRAWLRRPRPRPSSLLLYVVASAAARTSWIATKQRVRRRH